MRRLTKQTGARSRKSDSSSPNRSRPGPNLRRSQLDCVGSSKGSRRRSIREADLRRESSSSEDEQPKRARWIFHALAGRKYNLGKSKEEVEKDDTSTSDIFTMKKDKTKRRTHVRGIAPVRRSNRQSKKPKKLMDDSGDETDESNFSKNSRTVRRSNRKSKKPKKLIDDSGDETDESNFSKNSRTVPTRKEKPISSPKNNPNPNKRHTQSRNKTDNKQLLSSSKHRSSKWPVALQKLVNASDNESDILPEIKIEFPSPVCGLRSRSQQDSDSSQSRSRSKRLPQLPPETTRSPKTILGQQTVLRNYYTDIIPEVEVPWDSPVRNNISAENEPPSRHRRSLRGTQMLEMLLDASDREPGELSSDDDSEIDLQVKSEPETPTRESPERAQESRPIHRGYTWMVKDMPQNLISTGPTPKQLDLEGGGVEKQMGVRLVKCDQVSPRKNTDQGDSASSRHRSRPGSNLSMVKEEDEAMTTPTRHRAATRLLSPSTTAANGVDDEDDRLILSALSSQQQAGTAQRSRSSVTPLLRSPSSRNSQPSSPTRTPAPRSQPGSPLLLPAASRSSCNGVNVTPSKLQTEETIAPPSPPVERSQPDPRPSGLVANGTPLKSQPENSTKTPSTPAKRSQSGTPISRSLRKGVSVTPSKLQPEETIAPPSPPVETSQPDLRSLDKLVNVTPLKSQPENSTKTLLTPSSRSLRKGVSITPSTPLQEETITTSTPVSRSLRKAVDLTPSSTHRQEKMQTPAGRSEAGTPSSRLLRKGVNVTPSMPQREEKMTTPSTPAAISEAGTPISRSLRKGVNVTPSMPQREGTITTPSTPMEEARAMLHVSAVPKDLRCREDMTARIRQFLEARLDDQSGGAMYISGVPGTGKTATVRKVIAALQLEYTFPYVEVNGMRMTTPHQLYVQIHEELAGVRLPWEQAMRKLDERFTNKKKAGAIVLVDELDLICNTRQDVVYNLLDWPRRSRLVVITIANTMDLPERLLQGKVASRLGLSRVVFKPYTSAELEEIVTARLLGIKAFEQDAVRFVAKKVASISGDCRRALDICRRATEVAENQSAADASSQSQRSAVVSMEHVQMVLDEMMSSYKVKAIKGLSHMEQLFLRAAASSVDAGTEQTNFTKTYRDLLAYCTLDGVKAATASEALAVCSRLAQVRLLICQGGRHAVRQKILLNCDPDDIHYALNKT